MGTRDVAPGDGDRPAARSRLQPGEWRVSPRVSVVHFGVRSHRAGERHADRLYPVLPEPLDRLAVSQPPRLGGDRLRRLEERARRRAVSLRGRRWNQGAARHFGRDLAGRRLATGAGAVAGAGAAARIGPQRGHHRAGRDAQSAGPARARSPGVQWNHGADRSLTTAPSRTGRWSGTGRRLPAARWSRGTPDGWGNRGNAGSRGRTRTGGRRPGRPMVEGNAGWLGESGKCWVSRQNANRRGWTRAPLPPLQPSRKSAGVDR